MADSADRPDSVFSTVIVPNDAPAGTFTLISVDVDDSAVARVAPKLTMFFAAVVLKFCPVIVTSVSKGALVGRKERIIGLTSVKKLAEPEGVVANPLVAISL